MKNKIFILLSLLIVIVGIQVHAKEDNSFYADLDVKLNKGINATTFIAGNNVDVSSEIDGASFIAGNNLTISSSQDYVFAAGNIINLQNVKTKDAYLAGSIINIKSSSIRDLYATADNIVIDSDISRNAYLAGDSITINSKINGNVKVAAENIIIGEEAIITGTLKYPEEVEINIASGANVTNKETYKSKDIEDVTISTKITDSIFSLLSILVIGLILLVLNKKLFIKIDNLDKNVSKLAVSCGIGFAFLIIVPISALIILLSIIGIPLSIITLLIYGILIYLSIIPATYYLGNWIFKDKITNKYILLTISLLVVYILKMIPVVGGLVSFILLCLGLGIYNILIYNYIKEK